MIVRGLLYVTGLLLRVVDWALVLVVEAIGSLHKLWSLVPVRRWYGRALAAVDRSLLAGRDYLQAVGARLRCRLAYEGVTATLRRRYRQLRERS